MPPKKRDPPAPRADLLPAQPIALDVLREKYLKHGEKSVAALYRRVAHALASAERPEHRAGFYTAFRRNLEAGAIGAGRIMSAAGTPLQATLINCFVQPVGDSIQGVDKGGFPGIYEALREAAETMRRGGGVGYDFSRIRPRGAEVSSTASTASGPCSYINVFDQSGATTESAGARRGAQMGVLRIDHPDVIEFVRAKRTPGRWNNFNISVGVTDAYMQAVEADHHWQLLHRARPGAEQIAQGAHQREDGFWVYRTLPARELWDVVMRSAYDFAEPGVVFLDQVNLDNNLRYCETLAATNPCGEQPLPPYGCCDLGPIVLPRFVEHPFGLEGPPSFDFDRFARTVALQVRALDNVLEITYWPLDPQQEQAIAKRRIGVGFTGLANALAMLCLRYDHDEGREMAVRIARCMRDAAYEASVALAVEKGPFPAFVPEGYLAAGTFASRLDPPLKAAIAEQGIRNSHLLSIAPTGTVSLAFADNASNGVEPSFSWTYRRSKREADGSRTEYMVEDHAWRLYKSMGGDTLNLPDYFVTALQMSTRDHIAMVQALQPFIDTAISKTVNVPADLPFEDFEDLYLHAWRAGLKGLATYRPNEILGAVLHAAPAADASADATVDGAAAARLGAITESRDSAPETPEEAAARAADPLRATIELRPAGELGAVVEKIEYWSRQQRKTLHLVVSFLPVPHGDAARERAIEFFMPAFQGGQSGPERQWIAASMRLLSVAARGGFLDRALADMRKVAWAGGPVRLGVLIQGDGAEVPQWHDSEVAAIAFAIQNIIAHRAGQGAHAANRTPTLPGDVEPPLMAGKQCDACGAYAVIRKDGCDYCTACGELGACG